MRPRIPSKPLLLVVVLLLDAALTGAALGAPTRPTLVLSFHGTRALNGNGSKESGWGGGGSVRYSIVNGMKVCACVERVRVARDGSTFVTTVTPWTIGVELGPRAPRRIQPIFRIGLGMYRLEKRGEFTSFFTGQPAQYSDSRVFSGLNLGGGVNARLVGGAILEFSATLHQSFSSESHTDGPILGEVKLASFRAGLGYAIR